MDDNLCNDNFEKNTAESINKKAECNVLKSLKKRKYVESYLYLDLFLLV